MNNKTTVVNINIVKGKRPHFDIYIGRITNRAKIKLPISKWNNPYPIKKYGLKKSFELYEKHIRNNPKLWNSLHELEGRVLGCWCAPRPCHGDILLKLLKEKNKSKIKIRVYIKCPFCLQEDRSYMDENKIIECCNCKKTFHLMYGREENKPKLKTLKDYLENKNKITYLKNYLEENKKKEV